MALFLAGLGVYGVLSFAVSQRVREIGLRSALGAKASDNVGLFLRKGLGLAVAGVAIGIVGALGLTQVVGPALLGTASTDTLSLAVPAMALLLVAVVSCYVPARRAARSDPSSVLRGQ